jgi:hypothetical protein
MDHVHGMTALGQRIGQAVDENSIPAKVVGRVKRGDHAEPHD